MDDEVSYKDISAEVVEQIKNDPEEMYDMLRFAIEEDSQKFILCVLDSIARAYGIILSGPAYITDENGEVIKMTRDDE